MNIETDTSFSRDAKKLPEPILDELKLIYEAIEQAQSLNDIGYEIKKWRVAKNQKHFD